MTALNILLYNTMFGLSSISHLPFLSNQAPNQKPFGQILTKKILMKSWTQDNFKNFKTATAREEREEHGNRALFIQIIL